MKTPQTPFSPKPMTDEMKNTLRRPGTKRSLVRAASLRPQRSMVRKGLRPVVVKSIVEEGQESSSNE